MSWPKRRDGESDADFAARIDLARARERERGRNLPSKREYDRKRRRKPEVRERNREYQRHWYRNLDPAVKDARLERQRQRSAARRNPPPEHPGTCDLCGVVPPPRSNGHLGLNQDHRHDNNVVRGWLCTRCNNQVAVMDLAFLDPDRYAALKAWSLRGAPVIPHRTERSRPRRQPVPDPTLFGGGK